jgi:hypothetical protein
MREPAQWEMFRRTKCPSRGALLLIVAALVLPTHSYFLQEMRFWFVVLAFLVGLGAFLLAAVILMQEATYRGLHWMKLHVGRITVSRHGRIILQSAMPRHLPHH